MLVDTTDTMPMSVVRVLRVHGEVTADNLGGNIDRDRLLESARVLEFLEENAISDRIDGRSPSASRRKSFSNNFAVRT